LEFSGITKNFRAGRNLILRANSSERSAWPTLSGSPSLVIRLANAVFIRWHAKFFFAQKGNQMALPSILFITGAAMRDPASRSLQLDSGSEGEDSCLEHIFYV
jgi:hypothetical protein